MQNKSKEHRDLRLNWWHLATPPMACSPSPPGSPYPQPPAKLQKEKLTWLKEYDGF